MATEEKITNRRDYIAHGSDQHAALLGLKKADKESALQMDGWTLIDITVFGPSVTETFLREVLRQKVSELRGGAPALPQSDDPTKPNYAKPMWRPTKGPIE